MKKTAQTKKSSSNISARNRSFSTNPKQELKKVTWPNRDTLIKSTILIIVIIIILTIYISILDVIFSELFYFLREKF